MPLTFYNGLKENKSDTYGLLIFQLCLSEKGQNIVSGVGYPAKKVIEEVQEKNAWQEV